MADWIKLHRSVIDSKQFANPVQLKIWLWLLCKAAYSDRNISLKIGRGFVTVPLKRGQLIFGRSKAEEFLCIDGSTIYKHLQALEVDKAIKIKSSSQYSIITIVKYNDYQSVEDDDFEESEFKVTGKEQPNDSLIAGNEQPNSSGVAAEGQRSSSELTHIKKDKKVKENKEQIPLTLPFDSLIFISAWENWKSYKKSQHKFSYKPHSEQAALNDLKKISTNDEQTAIKIIEKCIAKGWKGLFYTADIAHTQNINNQPSQPIIYDQEKGRTFNH